MLRGGRLLARLVVNVRTLSLEGSLRKGILVLKFSIHSNPFIPFGKLHLRDGNFKDRFVKRIVNL